MKQRRTNQKRRHGLKPRAKRSRSGSAALDYVLVLGVIFPLAAFLMVVVPRMIKLVYELIVVTVNSPMM